MDNKSVVGADSAWRSSINCRRIGKIDSSGQRNSIDSSTLPILEKGGLVHKTLNESLYSCSWAKVHNNKDYIAFQNTTRNRNILKIVTIRNDKKIKEPVIEVCLRQFMRRAFILNLL